jgi:hypothetical protein
MVLQAPLSVVLMTVFTPLRDGLSLGLRRLLGDQQPYLFKARLPGVGRMVLQAPLSVVLMTLFTPLRERLSFGLRRLLGDQQPYLLKARLP